MLGAFRDLFCQTVTLMGGCEAQGIPCEWGYCAPPSQPGGRHDSGGSQVPHHARPVSESKLATEELTNVNVAFGVRPTEHEPAL